LNEKSVSVFFVCSDIGRASRDYDLGQSALRARPRAADTATNAGIAATATAAASNFDADARFVGTAVAPADTTATGRPGARRTDWAADIGHSGSVRFGKQGDKYMLQDAASGTTYDIDHQDEVKKFEGKKVKVHGTLDSTGKKILVQ
jgi:hypothetical protein